MPVCLSVCLSQLANCRSQFLLDRLGRCLKLFVSTESTSRHEFASQFGLEFFNTRKTLKPSGKPGRQCQCLFQWSATSHCRQWSRPSRLGATDPSNIDNLSDMCVWVCARVRADACARVCVRSCARSCVRACVRSCVRACMCAFMCACVRACVRACVCVCVRVCVRACVHGRAGVRACGRSCVRDVFAIYDNNIRPRLIMIIIKNIILYFIQIRHTDDLPSTCTWLVTSNPSKCH